MGMKPNSEYCHEMNGRNTGKGPKTVPVNGKHHMNRCEINSAQKMRNARENILYCREVHWLSYGQTFQAPVKLKNELYSFF